MLNLNKDPHQTNPTSTLPSRDILDLGLPKRTRLGRRHPQSALIRRPTPTTPCIHHHRRPRHNLTQMLLQKRQQMPINLLKLKQKRIMSIRRINRLEHRIRYMRREFLLLGEGEEAVGLDAQDECWLGDQGEGVLEGGDGV
jgi:hypothetical protein